MITDIDKGIQEFYKTCPELIKKIDEWQTVKLCVKCDGELFDHMPCMHYTRAGQNIRVNPNEHPFPGKNGSVSIDKTFSVDKLKCPTCGILPSYKNFNNIAHVITSEILSHKIIYKRKCFTKIPNWWGRFCGEKEEYFWEYVEKTLTNTQSEVK